MMAAVMASSIKIFYLNYTSSCFQQFSHAPHVIGNPDHCVDAAIDIRLGRRPRGYADAHGRLVLPASDSTPAGAVCLQRLDDARARFSLAEGDKDLIEHDIVQNRVAGRCQALGKSPRVLRRKPGLAHELCCASGWNAPGWAVLVRSRHQAATGAAC